MLGSIPRVESRSSPERVEIRIANLFIPHGGPSGIRLGFLKGTTTKHTRVRSPVIS